MEISKDEDMPSLLKILFKLKLKFKSEFQGIIPH